MLFMTDHIGLPLSPCAGAPANGRMGATWTSTLSPLSLVIAGFLSGSHEAL